MARGGKEARFRGTGQFGLPLGRPKLFRYPPPLGDVGKADDNTFNSALLGAIRQDTTGVPDAVPRVDFGLERGVGPQHRCRIGQQRAVHSQRRQVRERPPNVAGDDVEECLGGGCEEANVEAGVEEQRRHIGAVQDILQIVGNCSLPLQSFLKLAVEGRKFLVERLQFLL